MQKRPRRPSLSLTQRQRHSLPLSQSSDLRALVQLPDHRGSDHPTKAQGLENSEERERKEILQKIERERETMNTTTTRGKPSPSLSSRPRLPQFDVIATDSHSHTHAEIPGLATALSILRFTIRERRLSIDRKGRKEERDREEEKAALPISASKNKAPFDFQRERGRERDETKAPISTFCVPTRSVHTSMRENYKEEHGDTGRPGSPPRREKQSRHIRGVSQPRTHVPKAPQKRQSLPFCVLSCILANRLLR